MSARSALAAGVAVGARAGALGGGGLGLLEALRAVWLEAAAGAGGGAGRLAVLAAAALGLAAGAGTLVGAAAGLVHAPLARGAAALASWRRAPARSSAWQAALYGALASGPLALLALSLLSGRRARTLPWRPLWVALATLAGALAVALAVRVVLAALARADRRPGASRLLAAGSALVALAAWQADLRVLPRLYPALHLGFGALALGGAALAGRLALARAAPPGLRGALGLCFVPLGALATLLASGAAGGRRGPGANPLRFALHRHAPVGGKVLAWLPGTRPEVLALGPGAAAAIRAGDGPQLHPPPPSGLLAGRDVLLVTVDALRADRLGVYGHRRAGRSLTPVLDRLAARGIVFARAYCQTPHTSYSLSSLFTSRYPGALGPTDRVRPPTLADWLGRGGYRTAGFFPPAVFYIDGPRFAALERERLGFVYVKYQYDNAAARRAQLLRFLDEERPRRFFAWIHLFEPHEPYEAHPGLDFGPRAADRYDAEVAEVDRQLGQLLEALGQRRPGTVVVVTADHGEELGDHGGYYHGSSLYDEQVRVPLILATLPSAPGERPPLAPRRVAETVSLVDLAPTLLSLLGQPVPSELHGRDLSPLLAGTGPVKRGAEPLAPGRAFAQLGERRMLVVGHDKLVCDGGLGFCERYDLRRDPGERQNLAGRDPAATARLRARLSAWAAFVRAAAEERPSDLALSRARALLRQSATLPPSEQARALAEALGRERDFDARRLLVAALGRTRSPRARAPLEALVADVRLGLHAVRALGELGDPAAAPALAARLPRERYTGVRRELARVLGRLGDRAQGPALLSAFRRETEPEVADALLRAAAALGTPEVVVEGEEVVREPAGAGGAAGAGAAKLEVWAGSAGPGALAVEVLARGGAAAARTLGSLEVGGGGAAGGRPAWGVLTVERPRAGERLIVRWRAASTGAASGAGPTRPAYVAVR